MQYCIPVFTDHQGFGSRGQAALKNVVAARLNKQYVLGCREQDLQTSVPNADDQRFLTFVKEDWWPLYQVVTGGPYSTMGLERSMRSEFHSQHVGQLHTHQVGVHTPPVNNMYIGLEHGTLYTIYKRVAGDEYQVNFGTDQKYFSTDELHNVDLSTYTTESPSEFKTLVAVTKGILDYLVQPYEQLLRYKKMENTLAETGMQTCLDYVVNSDEMGQAFSDILTEAVSQPTFEQRAEMAEQLQVLHTLSLTRIRETTEQKSRRHPRPVMTIRTCCCKFTTFMKKPKDCGCKLVFDELTSWQNQLNRTCQQLTRAMMKQRG
jgi:hypothetical protein